MKLQIPCPLCSKVVLNVKLGVSLTPVKLRLSLGTPEMTRCFVLPALRAAVDLHGGKSRGSLLPVFSNIYICLQDSMPSFLIT